MDWGATLDDALFAVKTSAYLGSFGNMNLSNDIVLTDLNNGNIVNTNEPANLTIEVIEVTPPGAQSPVQVYTDGYAQINVGKVDVYIWGKVNVDIDAVNARITELKTIETQQPNMVTIEMQKELIMLESQEHNYIRSQQMNEILNNAGIADTPENNMEIARLILETSVEVNSNNLETNVLLVTPNGIVLLVAKWQILGDGTPYLTTIILKTA
jgi:hypothetical protein